MNNIQLYRHTDVMKRTYSEGILIKNIPEASEMAKTQRNLSPSLMTSVLFLEFKWQKEKLTQVVL